MAEYQICSRQDMQTIHATGNKISNALRCYIHLIHEHDKDDEFEYIVQCLNPCDLNKCQKFRRNYRNRNASKYDGNNKLQIRDKVYYETMDKIHCYFYHSFDIGHRLSNKDRMLLNEASDNKEENDEPLVNLHKLKILQLLSLKQKNIHSSLEKQKRFNQLVLETVDDKIYSYGYPFAYVKNHWSQHYIYTLVKEKYQTLKQEVTQNEVHVLSLQQFNTEFQKAQIHFNSCYRMKNYPYMWEGPLLSLLLYCNYTGFQNAFSKSYRENEGKNHNSFYWMGMCLQHCLSEYGTYAEDGNITSFYHGVDQQLIFPYKSKGAYTRGGIHVLCPLSTSSSFAVAVNFTADNNGLIVEFVENHQGRCKYFPTCWVSDFANEAEHLFLQSPWDKGCLYINNIINSQNAMEYKIITEALLLLDNMLFDAANLTEIDFNANSIVVPENMRNILHKIIQCRLRIKTSSALDQYATKMCQQYFDHKKHLVMDFEKQTRDKWGCEELFRLLMKCNAEVIDWA
eukprot:196120_1